MNGGCCSSHTKGRAQRRAEEGGMVKGHAATLQSTVTAHADLPLTLSMNKQAKPGPAQGKARGGVSNSGLHAEEERQQGAGVAGRRLSLQRKRDRVGALPACSQTGRQPGCEASPAGSHAGNMHDAKPALHILDGMAGLGDHVSGHCGLVHKNHAITLNPALGKGHLPGRGESWC